tara:strand:+ start:4003 stop:4359 length:357 start_codon:yes stop_codon:yes gene_type:complete
MFKLPDIELEQALDYHDKLTEMKAKATADVYKYTEKRKIAYSIAMINTADLKATQSMKDSIANSDVDVIKYVDMIADAKEKESLYTGKINNLEHKLRLFQTLSANERREKGFYQQNGG